MQCNTTATLGCNINVFKSQKYICSISAISYHNSCGTTPGYDTFHSMITVSVMPLIFLSNHVHEKFHEIDFTKTIGCIIIQKRTNGTDTASVRFNTSGDVF